MHLLDTPAARRYRLLYADPPWHFGTHSAKGQAKSASRHYPTMTLEAMLAEAWPVGEVAANDAWLCLWCTFPHLEQAFQLVASWSDPANPWRYTTGASWAKRPRGWRGNPDKWQFWPGYIFRGATEPLLVWKRGAPPITGKAERGLWTDPVREHSRKPDSTAEQLVRCLPGPRLEMFARQARPGFDAWGNEVARFT